jgi:hypothetical protein
VTASAYWPGWDIARGITLLPAATKSAAMGWTVDGFGGLHPFGGAPLLPATAYWSGWDIARGVIAWSGGGTGGWVLDGWGGLHPFGAAPVEAPSAYWPRWDIANGVAGPGATSGARKES